MVRERSQITSTNGGGGSMEKLTSIVINNGGEKRNSLPRGGGVNIAENRLT